jgi:hypothetical protein
MLAVVIAFTSPLGVRVGVLDGGARQAPGAGAGSLRGASALAERPSARNWLRLERRAGRVAFGASASMPAAAAAPMSSGDAFER